uniref:Uncharacterized protein n=1 Tax=Oryza sativa subsp. japonica TaxID=39947 RepID=Q651K1_ORYSJ|nr:hypothetical protein [Oryza sativa Japonica Group]
MAHSAPACDSEGDVQVLENSIIVHHCCPGAGHHYHLLHVDAPDHYLLVSSVRGYRDHGGYDNHGDVGPRSSGLLAPRSRDVVRKHDVGNDSCCLTRVVLLGGCSDGRGDRRCREVEGTIDITSWRSTLDSTLFVSTDFGLCIEKNPASLQVVLPGLVDKTPGLDDLGKERGGQPQASVGNGFTLCIA